MKKRKQIVRRVREPRIRKLAGLGAAAGAGCSPRYSQRGETIQLSPTQCKVFKVKGAQLGAGAFATVYQSGTHKNRVVKFTTDVNDAAAAAILKGKKLSGTVRVYDVAKLEGRDISGNGKYTEPLYGIVTEKVAPTNSGTPAMYAHYDAANSFYDSLSDESTVSAKHFKPGPNFTLPPGFNRRAVERCVQELRRSWRNADPVACKTIIPKMTRAVIQAGKKGGIFTQDLHAGNWGVRKNGQIAILDFGISLTDPAVRQPVPALAKAPRMARRRRVR